MKLTTFVVAIIATVSVYSQNILDNISFPSPNATGLGMYGEIPVSLASGTPQIDVPIYEIKEGTITVPIALNYHSSGIRPDVHPGWVGSGWSLDAGGM
ncbi:MAG: hypothetical protein MRY83_24335, partial [Flavobacteriales bacterium]|nr:hypothetical protein [Flavobacteriales bacterium]